MNIAVKARHMDITDAMREYVDSKVGKLPRYYDSIQTIEVTMDVQAGQSLVEIVAVAKRKHTFVASHRDEDMYACLDRCLDKISEQVRRHKDRVRDRKGAHRGQGDAETLSQ